MHRLYRYFTQSNATSNQKGFIPDIITVLNKYNLMATLHRHIVLQDSFPTKVTWKRLVNACINNTEQEQFTNRTNNDSDFSLFRNLHDNFQGCAKVWQIPNSANELRLCETVARLWVKIPDAQLSVCSKCESIYNDSLTHILTSCPITTPLRDKLLRNTVMFPEHTILNQFINDSSDEILKQLLLGRIIPLTVSVGTSDYYAKEFTLSMYKYVTSAIRYNQS